MMLQQLDLVVAPGVRAGGLDVDRAERPAAHRERHREQRLKQRLVGLRQELEPRVVRGVGRGDRPPGAAPPTRSALRRTAGAPRPTASAASPVVALRTRYSREASSR